jgi:hypothetical protein
MNAIITTPLSQRDLAILRAVPAGRCEISKTCDANLVIDGMWFTDQLAGPRLTEARFDPPRSARRSGSVHRVRPSAPRGSVTI